MRSALVALLAAAPALARAGEPVLTLSAGAGWFEEAFALDDAGGRLAVARTGDKGEIALELLDVDQGGAVLWRAPLAAPPASLELTRSGGVLVLTRRDAGVEAVVFDAAGKPGARFGPATDIARSQRGARELVAVHTVRGATRHVVIHDLARKKPLATRTLTADAAGHVASIDLTVRGTRAGLTQLAGRRPGRYDAKLDRRLNDTEAVHDLVEGKTVRDAAPADLVAAARIARERAARPGLDTFVFFSEDRARLLRLGADDTLAPVDLAVTTYDPASLAQVARGEEILFSLAVDPLNPEALARRKRDVEVIDVFRLAPGAPPVRVARLPRDGRDLVWRAGGSRLAVLKKHRTFGRGGPDLEVHELER
jgi:hypothetical protein